MKRILNFLVKTNVNVDKTQDVTKMKKKPIDEKRKYNPLTGEYEDSRPQVALSDSPQRRLGDLIADIRVAINKAEGRQ